MRGSDPPVAIPNASVVVRGSDPPWWRHCRPERTVQRLRASAAAPNLLPCAVPSSSPPRSRPPSPLRRRPRRAAPSSWRRRPQEFSVSPASIAPGATLTIRYRIGGRPRRVRVRVDLVPAAGGRPAATLPLGRQRTGRGRTATWRPELAPGRYTARLRATTLKRRGARTSQQLALEIVAPPVTAASGVFPVQGPYSLGGQEARFGAGRTGHTHQGQDILAASGTPVVAPRAGFVSWRAFQKDGAGHYVVLRGDDGRDYVFMHMRRRLGRRAEGPGRRGRAAARRRRLDRRRPTARTCTSRSGPTAGTRARPRSRSTRCPTCSPGPRSLEGVDRSSPSASPPRD